MKVYSYHLSKLRARDQLESLSAALGAQVLTLGPHIPMRWSNATREVYVVHGHETL